MIYSLCHSRHLPLELQISYIILINLKVHYHIFPPVQELALYPEITMEETLFYFGRIYQMSERNIKDRISFLAEFLDIPDKRKLIRELR